jgi:hypothetical protein
LDPDPADSWFDESLLVLATRFLDFRFLAFFLLLALPRFAWSPVSLLELELLGESDDSESSSMVTTSSILRFFFVFPALRDVCFLARFFLVGDLRLRKYMVIIVARNLCLLAGYFRYLT